MGSRHSSHSAAYPETYHPGHADHESSFFGSSYRSPYPYHKRDYDVHKKIWDPYVNSPSKAQRFFEILSLLILVSFLRSYQTNVLKVRFSSLLPWRSSSSLCCLLCLLVGYLRFVRLAKKTHDYMDHSFYSHDWSVDCIHRLEISRHS